MVSYIKGGIQAKGIWKQYPDANNWDLEMRMLSGRGSIVSTSYCLPNIVRVIKCRRLRLTGNMARMEEGRSSFKILTGKLKLLERDL